MEWEDLAAVVEREQRKEAMDKAGIPLQVALADQEVMPVSPEMEATHSAAASLFSEEQHHSRELFSTRST